MIDADGRPLLNDLGAARVAVDCGIPVAANPGYVAPEVARGSVPDGAADVFALGAVALHCLSGRPAWNADDLRDVVVQSTVGQWPDPDDGDAPGPLLAAVRSALLDVPARRPGAASLVVDLSKMGGAEPIDLGPVGGAEPAGQRVGGSREADERAGAHRLAGPSQDTGPGTAGPGTAASQNREAGTGGSAAGGADAAGSVARQRIRQVATRLRPDAVRFDSAAAMHAGHRRSRAGRHVDRRNLLRGVGLALALALLGALAVQAGLIWAGAGRQHGSSAPAAADDDGPATSSRSVAAGLPRSSSPDRRTASVPPRSQPTSVRTPVPPAQPADGTAAGSSAAPGTSWLTVASELDRARARALVGRDPDLLDAVYTASAPARRADAATIARLTGQDLRVDGAAHRILAVQLLAAGDPVRIEVTDELPSYHLLDADGTAVGSTGARTQARRVLELVRTAAGYRISAVSEA
jgi:serine/threonine-protein kinase